MKKGVFFSFGAAALLAVLLGVLACSVQQSVSSGGPSGFAEKNAPGSLAVITSSNLLPDPSFEDTNWNSYQGSTNWHVNWLGHFSGIQHKNDQYNHVLSGQWGIYMYTAANMTGSDMVWLHTSNRIAFQPGKAAVAGVWFPKSYTNTNRLPAGHLFIQVDFLDAAGSTNESYRKTFNASQLHAFVSEEKTNSRGVVWKKVFFETPSSPARTAYAVLKLGLEKTNTPAPMQLTMTMDDASLHEADSGDPVIPGQTPWKDNQNGILYLNSPWNYTMGYHFTPQTGGRITRLGGYFNGAKAVSLWNRNTGSNLVTVQLASSNAWNYVEIPPVAVRAGVSCTVAVYLAGSGGSYRSSVQPFPRTYGDVRIDAATYVGGNGRPVNTVSSVMYGQVDVCFVPDGSVTNAYPVIKSAPVLTALAGSLYQYRVTATDPDGDVLTYSLVSGPSGMTVNASNGLVQWTPGLSQTGAFSVTLRVQDGFGGVQNQNYTLTVTAPVGTAQYPWKNNENGYLITNYGIVCTTGYHFTPLKNGRITKLGGKFNGTFLIILCNRKTGVHLARTNITATNEWVYITVPSVSVQAGTNYTLAVNTYTTNNMISGRSGTQNFPRTYGDIRIDGGGFYPGAMIPTATYSNWIYGMPDIEFIPDL